MGRRGSGPPFQSPEGASLLFHLCVPHPRPPDHRDSNPPKGLLSFSTLTFFIKNDHFPRIRSIHSTPDDLFVHPPIDRTIPFRFIRASPLPSEPRGMLGFPGLHTPHSWGEGLLDPHSWGMPTSGFSSIARTRATPRMLGSPPSGPRRPGARASARAAPRLGPCAFRGADEGPGGPRPPARPDAVVMGTAGASAAARVLLTLIVSASPERANPLRVCPEGGGGEVTAVFRPIAFPPLHGLLLPLREREERPSGFPRGRSFPPTHRMAEKAEALAKGVGR